MCLISIKPSGVPLTDFFLEGIEAGAEGNSHGHGYMLKREGKQAFLFSKGMWSGEELVDRVKSLKVTKGDILCVHNRLSTHGRKNSFNCHPFIVLPADREDRSWNKMLDVEGETELPLLMHNGIFSEYGYSNNFSDTFNFVRDFISEREVLKYSQSLVWLEKKIGYNKLAILHPKLGLIRIGDFTEDQGYYFSNGGYKSYGRWKPEKQSKEPYIHDWTRHYGGDI